MTLPSTAPARPPTLGHTNHRNRAGGTRRDGVRTSSGKHLSRHTSESDRGGRSALPSNLFTIDSSIFYWKSRTADGSYTIFCNHRRLPIPRPTEWWLRFRSPSGPCGEVLSTVEGRGSRSPRGTLEGQEG